jgi:hypothetical protein
VPITTTWESFISWETGMVLVQAANEAVAKKTQANPVATRFNMPRFPRLCRAEVKKLYSL